MNKLKRNKNNPFLQGRDKPDKQKNGFFKRAARSGRNLLVASALTLGLAGPVGAGVVAGTATMTVPRNAKADPVTIRGIRAEEVRLDLPLDMLDSQTQPIRNRRVVGSTYNPQSGRYGNSIQFNGVLFSVILEPGRNGIGVRYQSESGETLYDAEHLTQFAAQVEQLTGRQLDGVDLGLRFVLTSGTFDYRGTPTRYTTAYLVPVDVESEQFISCASDNGPCLAFEVSQFADRVAGGTVWLSDPPTRGIAQARP